MGRHARSRSASPLAALATAGFAVAAAIVLITGPGTSAALSDATTQPEQRITAGGLTLDVTQSTSWPVVTGAAAGSRGITTKSTTGIVPGVRAATVTFTITNASSSAVPAAVTGTVSAPKTAAWTAAESYTTVTGGGSKGCAAGAMSTTGSAITLPVTSSQALAPGASCTVTVTTTLSRYNAAGSDAAIALQGSRLADLAAFTLSATLTQTPR
ncbi:hypothetical protein SAMN04489806_2132 [Paramicrobacterium humi]|uniref:Alternate signal-mediated exported protein, RER_14450 family n=1 Tax=Paramicrobacterium humi TaxID=640635 RepID=A0A1H4NBI1_9MICO|nr:hypothetical protein [Microbacterium humi]SEB92205.1 hypothetical protein SAMN04489806_2132 [Microbacterium humi]